MALGCGGTKSRACIGMLGHLEIPVRAAAFKDVLPGGVPSVKTYTPTYTLLFPIAM